MAAGDDITLGEVARRLADIQSMVHLLNDKLDRDYVRNVEFAEIARRVSSLESAITWGVRVVLGIVIAALLGLIITQGGEIPR